MRTAATFQGKGFTITVQGTARQGWNVYQKGDGHVAPSGLIRLQAFRSLAAATRFARDVARTAPM